MLTAGVDCGQEGAVALVNGETRRILAAWDMPTYKLRVGKTLRNRVDPVEVLRLVEVVEDLGCCMVAVEDPGDRPGQAHLINLGAAFGMVHMACVAARVPFHIIAARSWKAKMRCPSDKFGAVQRADAIFPYDRHLLRGRYGGLKDGRAEAALLGQYAHDYVLLKAQPSAA